MSKSTLSCSVNRLALVEALAAAARVVDKKVIPIFGSVLLRAEEAGLRWWATDGTLWRSGLVPAAQAQGSGLVPAAQALSVLKACGTETVTLDGAGAHVIVKAGAFVAKLPALPLDDYPTVPAVGDRAGATTMPAATLRAMLAHVLPAAASTSLKYYLQGALFHLRGGELLCVATDGHQLAKVARPVVGADAPETVVSSVALRELAAMLRDADGDVAFALGERHVFALGEDVLVAQPVDGKFPAWDRVVPKATTIRFACSRQALLSGLERVSLIADDSQYLAGFAFDPTDGLTLSSRSAQKGEAVDHIDVLRSRGAAISFNLNPRYARNFVGACSGETVVCEVKDALSPILYRSTDDEKALEHDDVYIVMPMRG